MQKERAIIIESPVLVRLRNNLRLVLRLSVQKRRETLSNEIKIISSSSKKEILEKRNEVLRLDKILTRSICKCRVCSSYKNSVVYSLKYDYWLCAECYRFVQDYYLKKGDSVSIRFNILDPSFKF